MTTHDEHQELARKQATMADLLFSSRSSLCFLAIAPLCLRKHASIESKIAASFMRSYLRTSSSSTRNALRLFASMSFALLHSFAVAQNSSQQRLSGATTEQLHRGFVAAQRCETEIDDDLSAYRSCIDHLIDRRAHSSQEKLGIHFQAWIMADLMARQHSDFAVGMRSDQLKKMRALQRITRTTLRDLCAAKQVICGDISARVKAASP
jgi:hypothetical protein